MSKEIICCPCRNEALRSAARYLSQRGYYVIDKPAKDATHLLLPIPSFQMGDGFLAHMMTDLSEDIIVCGGNLNSPLLSGYTCIDFLKDPAYLAYNAAITAHCATELVQRHMEDGLSQKSILIVGWGRIGKCLCKKLHECDVHVSVAVRKESDRALLNALGYTGISIEEAARSANRFDAIINTVPHMILPDLSVSSGCTVLELASSPGISGPTVLDGRGLPRKFAPDRSGALIAETLIRLSFDL